MPKPSSIHLTHLTPLLPSHWSPKSLSLNRPLSVQNPHPPTYSVSRPTDSISVLLPPEPHSFLAAVCSSQSLLTGLSPRSCLSPIVCAPLLCSSSKRGSQDAIPLLADVQWIPTAYDILLLFEFMGFYHKTQMNSWGSIPSSPLTFDLILYTLTQEDCSQFHTFLPGLSDCFFPQLEPPRSHLPSNSSNLIAVY